MKNKKLNYILLPGVVIVWGLIMYRVFSGLSSEDIPEYNFEQGNISQVDVAVESFEYELMLDYRDPFLGKRPKVYTKPVKQNRPKQKPKPQKEPQKTKWPSVVYQGVIENKSSGGSLAMLKIGSSGYIVSEGELISEIEVQKITSDSIQLNFLEETRWIKK